jgi:molybdenum cofactor guanylyltransferase
MRERRAVMSYPTRQRPSWSAAILAGGRARRLGGQIKATLPVGGTAILTRQLRVLGALGVVPVVIANDPAPFDGFNLTVVPDRLTRAGAAGGLYTALAQATAPHVIVLAGDLPFVSAAFLDHLVSLRHDADAVVPRDTGGWHPLCACYSRHLAAGLAQRIERGQLRIADALSDWHVRAVESEETARFDHDGALLMNVNTPDDYERACQVARVREIDDPRS